MHIHRPSLLLVSLGADTATVAIAPPCFPSGLRPACPTPTDAGRATAPVGVFCASHDTQMTKSTLATMLLGKRNATALIRGSDRPPCQCLPFFCASFRAVDGIQVRHPMTMGLRAVIGALPGKVGDLLSVKGVAQRGLNEAVQNSQDGPSATSVDRGQSRRCSVDIGGIAIHDGLFGKVFLCGHTISMTQPKKSPKHGIPYTMCFCQFKKG